MNRVAPSSSKLLAVFLVTSVLVIIGSILFSLPHHEDGEHRLVFTLQDTSGYSVNKEPPMDRWSISGFGFTSCLDICPGQAYTKTRSTKVLKKKHKLSNLHAKFVSVDYLRDDSEYLEKYLSCFRPEFVGLPGTKLRLDLTTEAYGASTKLIVSALGTTSYATSFGNRDV